MSQPTYDVVAIGNAIVDVLSQSDDAFLAEAAMTKGSMQLMFSPEEADALYAKMGPGIEASGGSAANTVAGIAALGGKCGFIGQVADDALGEIFAHDIRAVGIDFATPASTSGAPTGRCLVLVTPDGQRTMNTFLGAAQYLPEAAVDPEIIAAGGILYLEGYLWNADQSRDAMRRAIGIAKSAERKVALTLSDTFVVEGHRAEFYALLDADEIDLLFANENELVALAEVEDFEAAVAKIAARVPTLVVTRGAHGAIAVSGGKTVSVAAEPIDRVVDTTGAGDLFAAGFLRGQAQGKPIADSLKMGAVCAAEIISHYGARAQNDLGALVARKLA